LLLCIYSRPVASLMLDSSTSHAVSATMNVAAVPSDKAAEIRSLSGTNSSIRSGHRRRSASRHIPLVGCPRGWHQRPLRQRRNLVLRLRWAPT